MDGNILIFFHSLLRYLVLAAVAYAGLSHLIGLLRSTPILNGERTAAIIAMVLCHIQLVLGLGLYLMRRAAYSEMAQPYQRFWKFEHIGMMIIAIVLVTLGRSLSKRAQEERSKQLRVAIFFLIALVIMLWYTPWPFTEIGHSRAWL
jgi:cell division protein FtsW (lipid II flippase)